MSETTSDTNQANVSDDPSMEDILASIRKIIADEDTAMSAAIPDAPVETRSNVEDDISGLEDLLQNAEAEEAVVDLDITEDSNLETSEITDAPYVAAGASEPLDEDITAELESLMDDIEDAEIDETLLASPSLELHEQGQDDDLVESLLSDNLAELESEPHSDSGAIENISSGDVSPSLENEVVDLDIEALLGDVQSASDTELEAIDNLLDDSDMMEEPLAPIEIPQMEVTPDSEEVSSPEMEALDQSEDDALFSKLEGLLEEPDAEPIPEELADGAMQENDVEEIAQTLADTDSHTDLEVILEEDDEDLNALLEGLSVNADDGSIDQEEDSLEDLISVSDEEIGSVMEEASLDVDINTSEITESEAALLDALETDLNQDIAVTTEDIASMEELEDEDISLVKSLMADLADPDADIAEDEIDDASLVIESELDSDTELETIVEPTVDYDEQTGHAQTEIDSDSDSLSEDDVSASYESELGTDAEDLESLLAIPEQEVEETESIEDVETKPTKIITDTPQQTLESVIADEAENLALNEDIPTLSEKPSENEDTRSALMDIAFEAEQSAVEIETSLENKSQEPVTPESVASETSVTTNGYSGTTGFGALVLGASAIGASTLGAGLTVSQTGVNGADELASDSGSEPELTEIETETNLTDAASSEALKETDNMPKSAIQSETMLDEVSKEASASAFASLNKVVEEKAVSAKRGDRIGDIVTELLRPMLKEWLDDNLKDIVERAVAKEVKRIASGD